MSKSLPEDCLVLEAVVALEINNGNQFDENNHLL